MSDEDDDESKIPPVGLFGGSIIHMIEYNKAADLLAKNRLVMGTSVPNGDSFFDAMAQGLSAAGRPVTIKSLRTTCLEYARKQYNNKDGNWVKLAVERTTNKNYSDYMSHIDETVAELSKKKVCWIGDEYLPLEPVNVRVVYGRHSIEGKVLCEVLGFTLHVYVFPSAHDAPKKIIFQGKGKQIISLAVVENTTHYVVLLPLGGNSDSSQDAENTETKVGDDIFALLAQYISTMKKPSFFSGATAKFETNLLRRLVAKLKEGHPAHFGCMSDVLKLVDLRGKCQPELESLFDQFFRETESLFLCDSIDVAEIRIRRGAYVNAICSFDSQSATALLSVLSQQRDVALFLIKRMSFAALEVCTESGMSALMIAAQHGFLDVVEELCKRRVSRSAVDCTERNTALMLAIRHLHSEVALFLIPLMTLNDLNHRNSKQNNALHLAARAGLGQVVRALCEAKVDPTALVGDQSPLYIAIQEGHAAVVEALIAVGVKLPQSGWFRDETLLTMATMKGHSEVALYVLSKCPVLADTPNRCNATPLHWACMTGLLDVVRALLQAGANIASQNNSGNTPLMLALIHKHPEIALMLLDSPAATSNVCCLHNKLRETALHWAVENNLVECVATLIGRIPSTAHCCKLSYHQSLMVTVVDGRICPLADISEPFELGDCRTPLDLAVEGNYNGITLLIVQTLVDLGIVLKNRRDIKAGRKSKLCGPTIEKMVVMQFANDLASRHGFYASLECNQMLKAAIINSWTELPVVTCEIIFDYIGPADFEAALEATNVVAKSKFSLTVAVDFILQFSELA